MTPGQVTKGQLILKFTVIFFFTQQTTKERECACCFALDLKQLTDDSSFHRTKEFKQFLFTVSLGTKVTQDWCSELGNVLSSLNLPQGLGIQALVGDPYL